MAFPVGAAIGAVGSVVGGLTGGKGAKKAAQIQQQTTREQIAALKENRDFLYGIGRPAIDRGNEAGQLYADFLYGDPTKAAAALDQYRNSTGYQDLLNTGLNSVKSGAYAGGLRDSGATLKALQARGMSLADQSAQGWLNNLNVLQQTGQNAFGGVAGVGMNTVNGINAANQTAATAAGNAAIIQNNSINRGIQGLFNAGANAFGSSYGNGGGSFSSPAGLVPYNGPSAWHNGNVKY